MIQVENLSRRYGDFTAVDRVSFSVAPGEVVGLLGHNGAGKTTIMKMLTGFLEPTAGRITIDGLDIGQDTSAIQSRIGYLPENCPVWPEMTVIDFLAYQAALHHVPEADRNTAIARAIRRTDLKDKATSTIQTLSRGYRQRVGVAQAILHDPKIVILDEPTNGLDPTQIHQMRALIRELSKTATVIVSTHILQEVQAVCERVMIMRSGRLVVDKHLDELRETDRIRLVTGADARPALDSVLPAASLLAETSTGNNRFEYHFKADETRLPVITDELVAANIPVFALAPEHRDLERVFAEVNGEVAHD
ncbi:ABC-2 type transport system ATP-binding protein [Marinobacter pelagius]|uniref:ABC-2 type transport system ATP-binding protein n=1 Tax=Marinobacter pelagius TaxID=379482 RepID=A0A366GXL3_9GAMM|nr:ABC transporter ATP-binding protein [Marinobacter pelagius]RBP32654.1 ABC-2 type transport system ATP-binding protein [Marinobacter pelagius]